MKAAFRSFAAAVITVALTPMAFAGHTHSPTPSTWTLDAGASDFGGGQPMKSDVMVLLVDTEKWLKFTDTTVDGDGKTWKVSWSGPQDGTFKPLVGMAGAKASFKTEDDSEHFIMPDGTHMDNYLAMSDDKKKVTINSTVKTKDGKEFHQTLIYHRTK